MRGEFYLMRKEKQKAHFFFHNQIDGVHLAEKSLLVYIQRLM